MKKSISFVFFISLFSGSNLMADPDPYLWLEEVEGSKALEWVKQQNALTDQSLGSDPLYQELYQQAYKVLSSTDKLPEITIKGHWVYQLIKSNENPRGLYVRSSMEDFVAGKSRWQTVVDIDKLSKAEGTLWVFDEMTCLEPLHEKCLLSLSPGGTDASVVREFDPNLSRFVEGGFEVPLAKTSTAWISENELFVGTDFGENSLTTSGYTRVQKIWRRGTPLSQAETILEVSSDAVSANASSYHADSGVISVLSDSVSFWKRDYYHWTNKQLRLLQLPKDALIYGYVADNFVILLKSDWVYEGQTYLSGAVILASSETLQKGKGTIQLLAQQSDEFVVEEIKITSKGIAIVALEDVYSRLYFYQLQNDRWVRSKVQLPDQGTITITGSNQDLMVVKYQDFLTPPSLYAVDYDLNAKLVLQQPKTFDASNMGVVQHFTQSADGTRVPYFVIKRNDLKMNGKNPTHIFSYGGFRNALQPSYSGSYEDHNGVYGKMWLERGGIYVIANIRGGGEYGPAWHTAALLDKRPRSFEDFEAIAEDLIKRNYTSSDHLSIEGRSQGGFLVGALMTRRPDLYSAVICGVPLLDMKRYNKLLAGASWMAEYGNPDTDDWNFISQYSPYQNLHEDVSYPPIFFFTSTKDDRVHPAHARKMAARMKQLGQTVEYYENLEGGHKGSATAAQTARRVALSYTHLWRHAQ